MLRRGRILSGFRSRLERKGEFREIEISSLFSNPGGGEKGSRDLGTWTANLNEGGEWKGGFLVESISRWIRFPSFVIVASLTLASWDVGGRLDLHARGNNTAEERSEGCFVRIRASGMETETGRSQRAKERTRGKARAHDDLRDEKYECLSDFLSFCRLDSTKLSF